MFSVRNVCANGRLWDGADGWRDYAAEQVAFTGKDRVAQNPLSMGFAPDIIPNMMPKMRAEKFLCCGR